jgi:hypothetical protein
MVTLWRPKIVDVQHDTLDYSASEAVTWQLSFRYESVTYSGEKPAAPGPQVQETPVAKTLPSETPEIPIPRRQFQWQTGDLIEAPGSDLPPAA